MSTHNEVIGKNIKNFRKEYGITMVELAEISGVSQAFISQIENNRRDFTLSTLDKLISALAGLAGVPLLVVQKVIFVDNSENIKLAVKIETDYHNYLIDNILRPIQNDQHSE